MNALEVLVRSWLRADDRGHALLGIAENCNDHAKPTSTSQQRSKLLTAPFHVAGIEPCSVPSE
jgi:hypothetical protein